MLAQTTYTGLTVSNEFLQTLCICLKDHTITDWQYGAGPKAGTGSWCLELLPVVASGTWSRLFWGDVPPKAARFIESGRESDKIYLVTNIHWLTNIYFLYIFTVVNCSNSLVNRVTTQHIKEKPINYKIILNLLLTVSLIWRMVID